MRQFRSPASESAAALEERGRGIEDVARVRQEGPFEGLGLWGDPVGGTHACDRGIEIVEGLLLDGGDDLVDVAPHQDRLARDDAATGLAHGSEHRLEIERDQAPEVDHLGLSTELVVEALRGLERIKDGTYRQDVEKLRQILAQGKKDAYTEAKERLLAFTPACAMRTRAKKVAWNEKLASVTNI